MTKRSLCLSPYNWADLPSTVISASAEITGLPVQNLLDEDVNQVWGVDNLSVGNTDFYVDVDLGQDLSIGVVALVLGWRRDRPHKILQTPMMALTDKVQVFIDNAAGTIGNGAAGGSGLIDCNINPYIGYFVYLPSAAITGRYVRVFIDAISRSTLGFWWGARLWIGPRHDFLGGHQYGHIEKFDINEFAEPIRTPSIPMQHVRLSEMPAMSQWEQLTTTEHQFLFTYDKAAPNDTTIIGKREATSGFQSSFFRNHGFTMQIRKTW